jgi:uncharacterized protein YlzI (FlbEa/FlbD family)
MINIIPVDDTDEHIEDMTCHCDPTIKIENGEITVVHNSFDLREVVEKFVDGSNIQNNSKGWVVLNSNELRA